MSTPRPLDLLRRVWSAEVDLSTPLAAVLTVLILHRNNETELCFPSVTTIAEETHQTRRGVMNQLHRLDELGVIEVERRRGVSNRYRLALPKLPTSERGSLVNNLHPCTTFTQLVNDVHPTSERGSPELLKNCQKTAKREADDSAPLPARQPKPPDGLVEIPVKQPTKGRPTQETWWLTEATRAEIAAEFPQVDVTAVAHDLARKVRAGAREPYTCRGMRRGLASWVAREFENGIKRSKPVKHAARVEGRDWDAEAEARRERLIADKEAELAAAGMTPEEFAEGAAVENC